MNEWTISDLFFTCVFVMLYKIFEDIFNCTKENKSYRNRQDPIATEGYRYSEEGGNILDLTGSIISNIVSNNNY